MNEKLVLTKVEIHKKQVERLKQIESELIGLISEIENDKLMGKFLDWQNQRSRCNATYIATISKLVDDSFTCYHCTDKNGQNIGNMYKCEECGRLVS
jgi:hypothetical protein